MCNRIYSRKGNMAGKHISGVINFTLVNAFSFLIIGVINAGLCLITPDERGGVDVGHVWDTGFLIVSAHVCAGSEILAD